VGGAVLLSGISIPVLALLRRDAMSA